MAHNGSTIHTNTLAFGGSGSSLHWSILLSTGIATLVATLVAGGSIWLQLKNYRKPVLQRQVVRIMLMVPIYAIASLISLFSLEAAFVIDAIRDIYEAFVIYCFFHLLVAYLGGERSLLILLYGRPPKHHLFPVNIFKREIDCSDPFTFLMLRRGIFQYVYVKPILAAVTLILKASGVYNEGDLKASSGYLWVSVVYNTSICVALYCLAMFWVCINDDVKPFRPVPKFLCVKGILFFCFWQALCISILVAAGAIRRVGPYTDAEHISLAISDSLICFEMPIFAFAHMFAFSHTDYIDPNTHYAARMPFYYAFRDAFGFLDVIEDSRATLKGSVSYQKYEPVEGGMHQGYGRDRRIRAGLRYAKGGQQKYWLPMPVEDSEPVTGPFSAVRNVLEDRRIERDGYAPMLQNQEEVVVNERPMLSPPSPESPGIGTPLRADLMAFSPPLVEHPDADLLQVEFDRPDEEEDALYAESQKLLFGDYHYPCIDVSSEAARKIMWEEEERILGDRRAAAFSPLRTESGLITDGTVLAGGRNKLAGYGATSHTPARLNGIKGKEKAGSSPSGFYHQGGEGVATTYQPSTPILDQPGARVIDMSPETSRPTLNLEGVQLNWTKSDRLVVDSRRKIKSPLTSPESNTTSQHLRPSLPNRGTSLSSAGSSQRSMPSDAVDLVVEDTKAAQLEMTKERRKGEPAVRQTGQRKVYKTTYEVEDESGDEKEVDVEHEIEEGVEDPVRNNKPEIDRTKIKVRNERGEEESEDEGDKGAEVAEMSITRATTPPAHAIIEVDRMKSPIFNDPHDNPWA